MERAAHAGAAAKMRTVELGSAIFPHDEERAFRATENCPGCADGGRDGFPGGTFQAKKSYRRAVGDPELAVRCEPGIERVLKGAGRLEPRPAALPEPFDVLTVEREDAAVPQHDPHGPVMRFDPSPTRDALDEAELAKLRESLRRGLERRRGQIRHEGDQAVPGEVRAERPGCA